MADDTEWKSYRDEWYNDRVMETYISAPIVDKQNDLVPTKTMEDAMDFYMKYGVYSFQHEEQPIGLPLAWKTEDGKEIQLVEIEESDILGNPCLVRVIDEPWEYKGKSGIALKVIDVLEWKDGTKLSKDELQADDLPF